MKKAIIVFLLLLIFVGFVFAVDEYKNMNQAPPLDVEGAYIIDLKPMRKLIKDNIAFVNLTEQKDISFDIYYVDYNTGEWVKNRLKGFVKGYNDRDIVELNKQPVITTNPTGTKENVRFQSNLNKIPFIAIVPKPAGDYKYKAYPQFHDVYIDITE